MDKVVAKALYGDLAEHMWISREANWGVCPTYHNTLLQIVNPSYRIGKKLRDFYDTYDGFHIVSERFKAFCDERQYPNLSFVALPKSPGYYFFSPEDIYEIDHERGKVQYITKRECCGSYDEIIIPGPYYKSPDYYIETDDFILRSRYMYASYAHKHPLIIVGSKTFEEMKKANILGITTSDVYE